MKSLNELNGLMTLGGIAIALITLAYFVWKDRHQDLRIIKAKYGKNNIYTDIKGQLNDRIADNKLEVQLTNQIVDDPVKGVPKIARIKYWYGGKRRRKEYVESELIKLP